MNKISDMLKQKIDLFIQGEDKFVEDEMKKISDRFDKLEINNNNFENPSIKHYLFHDELKLEKLLIKLGEEGLYVDVTDHGEDWFDNGEVNRILLDISLYKKSN